MTTPNHGDTSSVPAKPDSLERLMQDWRTIFNQAIDETEKFTREKPMIALFGSFAAGVIFNELMSAIFRRRK